MMGPVPCEHRLPPWLCQLWGRDGSWFRHLVPRKSSRKSPSMAFTGTRTRTIQHPWTTEIKSLGCFKKKNQITQNFPHALLKREDYCHHHLMTENGKANGA
jgi:hypothetical protein